MTNTLRDELAAIIHKGMGFYGAETYAELKPIADAIIDHLTPTLREVDGALQRSLSIHRLDADIEAVEQALSKLSALLGKGE